MSQPAAPNIGDGLTRVHRALTRALDVSQQNTAGTGPDPSVREGFKQFEQNLVMFLDTHHSSEDKIAFPFFEQRIPACPFADLCAQHQQMLPFLHEIKAWAESGEQAWEPASLQRVHTAVSGLNELWQRHIPVEEQYMTAEATARVMTNEESAALSQQLSNHGQTLGYPGETLLPFFFYNLQPEDRQEIAQTMPPLVTQQLIPVAWKHAWAPMQPFLLE